MPVGTSSRWSLPMQLRFYAQSATLDAGPVAGTLTTDRLVRALGCGPVRIRGRRAVRDLRPFRTRRSLLPPSRQSVHSAADYQRHVYDAVEADLNEALRPAGSSPIKAASEVLRFLRNPMREVIEFGGLTPEFSRRLLLQRQDPGNPPGRRPARPAVPAVAGADGCRRRRDSLRTIPERSSWTGPASQNSVPSTWSSLIASLPDCWCAATSTTQPCIAPPPDCSLASTTKAGFSRSRTGDRPSVGSRSPRNTTRSAGT